jgi:phosphoribosylformimino-5-aminoimidazole carboxamide ribonucleotide (ProFAR) isomerase
MASRRSLFRPCIDIHDGHVKQIVGGTLSETDPGSLKTNFVAKYAIVKLPFFSGNVAKIV